MKPNYKGMKGDFDGTKAKNKKNLSFLCHFGTKFANNFITK
jgi:hypothetical protein